jgi:hypothetical protein
LILTQKGDTLVESSVPSKGVGKVRKAVLRLISRAASPGNISIW